MINKKERKEMIKAVLTEGGGIGNNSIKDSVRVANKKRIFGNGSEKSTIMENNSIFSNKDISVISSSTPTFVNNLEYKIYTIADFENNRIGIDVYSVSEENETDQ